MYFLHAIESFSLIHWDQVAFATALRISGTNLLRFVSLFLPLWSKFPTGSTFIPKVPNDFPTFVSCAADSTSSTLISSASPHEPSTSSMSPSAPYVALHGTPPPVFSYISLGQDLTPLFFVVAGVMSPLVFRFFFYFHTLSFLFVVSTLAQVKAKIMHLSIHYIYTYIVYI